jgi:glyoxylase-like metal-dependent hydrolase (beta-lactamase superfamily II)
MTAPVVFPPAADGARLTAFTCGWLTLPLAFFLDGEAGSIRAPVCAFLIEHPKGLCLFDTGLGVRFQRRVDGSGVPDFHFEQGEDIGARLRSVGVDPAAIRFIINSHLHIDHAGGNSFLPNASIIIQEPEWEYALSGADRAYRAKEFDTGQPVIRVRGEHDLHGDGAVMLFPTPGHTPGHQSARVRTAHGDIILAADCCNLRRWLDEMRLPDHAHNAAAYLATLRRLSRMRGEGARIFFGHDPDFWAGVPQHTAFA